MSAEPWTLVGLHAAVRFTVHAEPSPGLLPRLLLPFAKRDLTPDSFEARTAGEAMRIDIAMAAMPAEMVHLVAGNLGQTVGVTGVSHRQEITGQVRRRAA
jgi:hypothetical protein